ncbi:MAG: hypothetical protein KAY24_01125 [Candidatus Eisenbacteria sp.]|nr:hypothetical protein [Candidatus Eisenbacteria bacterium]
MRLILILLLALATAMPAVAADPTGAHPERNPRFFWGTLTGTYDSTAETVIGCIPVEDVLMVSVVSSVVVTDNINIAGDLKIMGSSVSADNVALPSVFAVDGHSSLQAWSTTGAQSMIWIEDIKPCRYLVLTSTCSTGSTTPGTVTIVVRGIRRGEGGEQTW